MNRNFVFALLLLMFSANSVSAQQKGLSGRSGFQASFASLNNQSEFKGYEYYVSPGYRFSSNFSTWVQAEVAIAHFKVDGVKNFEENGTLGIGAGYNFLNSNEGTLELSVTAGNTLGGSDWKYLYIDGGLKWAIGKEKTRMYFGFGIRYYNSHNERYENYFNTYATIGFKIN